MRAAFVLKGGVNGHGQRGNVFRARAAAAGVVMNLTIVGHGGLEAVEFVQYGRVLGEEHLLALEYLDRHEGCPSRVL